MENKFRLLVVDDNVRFLESTRVALRAFEVATAPSIAIAKQKLTDAIDLVLLDLVFDDNKPDSLQGLELLDQIHSEYPKLGVVIMTNYSSTDLAVRTIKSGAIDFLNKKDLNWGEWKIRLENYCRSSVAIRDLEQKAVELEDKFDPSEIIGQSKEIRFVKERLRDLASSNSYLPVFITGETGTGKNLAVKFFKRHSSRRNRPYKEFSIFELSDMLLESELFGHVKGAFTGATSDKKGLFEEANGGILFLDEIGDYDLRTQKKIMRFIEAMQITPVGSTKEKRIDVQIIMATNQNIPQLIKEGRFRQDLYQRINRLTIDLPPLRERREDIPLLAKYFFDHFAERERANVKAVSPEVNRVLKAYDWPGNIRELQNVIWDGCTRARLVKAATLDVSHLRPEILGRESDNSGSSSQERGIERRVAAVELAEIDEALRRSRGNKGLAGKELGMTLDALRYKVLKYFKFDPRLLDDFKNVKGCYLRTLSREGKND